MASLADRAAIRGNLDSTSPSDDGVFMSPSIKQEDQSSDGESFCICRGPEHGFMIFCDGPCNDWYHGSCVGINEKEGDEIKTYICPGCSNDGLSTTLKNSTPKPVRSSIAPQQRSNGSENGISTTLKDSTPKPVRAGIRPQQRGNGSEKGLSTMRKDSTPKPLRSCLKPQQRGNDNSGEQRSRRITATDLIGSALDAKASNTSPPAPKVSPMVEERLSTSSPPVFPRRKEEAAKISYTLQELLEQSYGIPKRDSKDDIKDTWAYSLVAGRMHEALAGKKYTRGRPRLTQGKASSSRFVRLPSERYEQDKTPIVISSDEESEGEEPVLMEVEEQDVEASVLEEQGQAMLLDPALMVEDLAQQVEAPVTIEDGKVQEEEEMEEESDIKSWW